MSMIHDTYGQAGTVHVAGAAPIKILDPGILWSPIASPSRLRFTGTSVDAVATALVEAFGPFPIRLTTVHTDILRGMSAAAGPGKQPYQELLSALSQIGQLELTRVE